MATETRTRRQAVAKKSQATRKSAAARRSGSATKASARRTVTSAKTTGHHAGTTTKQASRTAGRRLDAAATRIGAFGRQAERALLIQVGALVSARDALVRTARRYSSLDRVTRELNRFERRGERVSPF